MPPALSLSELIEYTDWERGKWHESLRRLGDAVLALEVGTHGDGRFKTLGDLLRHIFSAEKRYIDRLSNRPLTDAASISNTDLQALFDFGNQSRSDLKGFVSTFPDQAWDVPQEIALMNNSLSVTPKKIVAHILLHEIRHWAQIGTLLRLNAMPGEFHDFLFSPVLGGEIGRSAG
ncbi:MAG: DinB family protein [Candidatus Acidiferrales bacterium]